MIISAVIRTYNREDKLCRAVWSVLSQEVDGAEVEVVVVDDSGRGLAPSDWQQESRVRVFTTNRALRSTAANVGAAVSRGDYLHILDDDDLLLPGAYQALLNVAENTSAVWVHGGYEEMNDDGVTLCTRMPVVRGKAFAFAVAGGAIPLGASLIRRDAFLAAGGISPTMVPGEDVELLQRIALLGSVEHADLPVSRFRVGPTGSTTTPWEEAEESGRRRREAAFAITGCGSELAASIADPRMRGRLVRYCVGSSGRRLRRGEPLVALSRLALGARLATGGLLSGRFWSGLARK